MSAIHVEPIDVDIVNATGQTLTLNNTESVVEYKFFRNTCVHKGTPGPIASTANSDPDDIDGAGQITAPDSMELTRSNVGFTRKLMGEVWSYTGLPGGVDEFIVRGRYKVVLTSGSSASVDVSAVITDRNKCIPFIGGKLSAQVSRSSFQDYGALAYIDSANNLVIDRNRSTTTRLEVWVTLVEFTGSNWTVGHVNASRSSGSKTLYLDSEGTSGTVADLTSWDNALIAEFSFSGDTGTNTAIEDLVYVFEPGSSSTTIQALIDSSSSSSGTAMVHVLGHPDIVVARSSLSKVIPNNGTYDFLNVAGSVAPEIASAAVEFSCVSDGSGTAHARGQLGANVISTNSIRTWVHRSGNTGTYRYGIADFSNTAGIPKPKIEQWPNTIRTDGAIVQLTGELFLSPRGTGKVYISDSLLFTDPKVEQAVITWTDTQIQFTLDASSYTLNQVLYIFVEDKNALVSGVRSFFYGVRPYIDVIKNDLSAAPTVFWTFDNTYNDEQGTLNASTRQGTPSFEAFVGARGSTHSLKIDERNQIVQAPDNDVMNMQSLTTRMFGGWIYITETQKPLITIYEEGGSVNNLCLFMGIGGILIAQLGDSGDDNVHVYSDKPLRPGRWYHILMAFDYLGSRELMLYVDGEKQKESFGNPLGATDLDSHSGDISFGLSESSLQVFGTNVMFSGPKTAYYSYWVNYNKMLTDSEVKEGLFLLGVAGTTTLSADTLTNMQSTLNTTYGGTQLPIAAVGLTVEQATDENIMRLEATNVQFDPDSTVHIMYEGTGILNWVNLGNSDADFSKCYSSGGGSINIINPAVLTVAGYETGSDIFVYEQGTSTLLDSSVNTQTTQYQVSVQVPAVTVVVVALGFVIVRQENVDTSSNAFLPIAQEVDRAYRNST